MNGRTRLDAVPARRRRRRPKARPVHTTVASAEGWRQSFPYSCGAAAMGGVLSELGWRPALPRVEAELALWRESTAVACPGSHPHGLAAAARRRGFACEVTLDGPTPWLWRHIARRHPGFSRQEYEVVERVLQRAGRAVGVRVRRGPLVPPAQPAFGLLLSESVDPESGASDPHWLGVTPFGDAVVLRDPLRPEHTTPPEPLARAWHRSAFEGARSWIRIWRVPGDDGRPLDRGRSARERTSTRPASAGAGR